MEQKTKIDAENGKQEIIITREFDLPVALLFKAYIEPEIIAQWMGTKVLKLENKKYGSYQFETADVKGNVAFVATGVIHEFITDEKITRTFEMEHTPFGVQLEFLTFEKLTDNRSKLTMHVVYKSVVVRDQILALPFAQGINMAHHRLENILKQIK
ncbi:uncharacterized protein YndB with AHSA1/START domain [Pedobacter sp. AK013]|uniref:SRPBCC domain-containing protein n=1 Tax=Pedobacter sp. AK013 TaxID=2723071 RepID=UPI00161A19EB|nr:SRPBCC domain-containing protein [Pedobacter sp. AK013]MBB6238609.1 uncharacterized protein YndB with AHSA1/START domain [Pedobacter sp. AK013]